MLITLHPPPHTLWLRMMNFIFILWGLTQQPYIWNGKEFCENISWYTDKILTSILKWKCQTKMLSWHCPCITELYIPLQNGQRTAYVYYSILYI